MKELFWLKAYIKSQIELYQHRVNLQMPEDGARMYSQGCIGAYNDILRKIEKVGKACHETIQLP